MKVFVLGRAAIEADSGLVLGDARFPGRQGRLLFACLVLQHGRLVPRDQLAEAIWGDTPPATWDKALTVLVSKLRTLLAQTELDGAQALTGAFGCYRLDLPVDCWIDAEAASDATRDAEQALATRAWETARASAGLAELLTRAALLPGENGSWVEDQRRGLREVRERALLILAEACLRTGDPHGTTRWAEEAVRIEPFRESGYRLLMAAHAAAGNRAEALRVYERCRTLLAEELGAYPSPETESIHRRMLDAPAEARSPETVPAPALARAPDNETAARATTPAPVPPSRRPVAPAVVMVAAAVAAVTAITAIVATHDNHRRTAIAANSVVALDPAGRVATVVPVGQRPVALAPAAGALWVANGDDQTVTRVDPATRQVRSIAIGGTPTALAAGPHVVWVSDDSGRVFRIDPEYNRAVLMREFTVTSADHQRASWPLMAAFGSLWVVHPDGYVNRIDEQTGRRLASVDVGNEPSAIAAGSGSVWVTNSADGTVTRIDPSTLLATTIPVGHGPAAIAINGDGVWVADAGDKRLARIDPDTNAVVGTTPIGGRATAVLATARSVWVADGDDGNVLRLDPGSGRVTRTVRLGGSPNGLAATAGRVWAAVGPAPPVAAPVARGGRARLTMSAAFPSLDPALAVLIEPGLLYATCANLVTYPDQTGPGGSRIVPEVAEAVPRPADGGTTYTFTIRPGYRFSPPSNRPVTARTFKETIERVVDPRMRSPAASEFGGVLGYRAYVTGQARGLSGVVAHGSTLTIRLTQPDGTLLADLAGGAACAVPPGTPVVRGGLDTVPAAGPYYVASYTPRRQVVLRRNPNYHGDRPHHLDQLVIDLGVDSARALAEIKAGTADYAVDGLPRDAGPRLEAEYGPGSAAARAGHQQYFINPANGVRLLHMNTSRPLFADVRLRRAVNYAIDRPALVAQGRRYAEVNPFNAGAPTDDYLPPTAAGTADLTVYPVHGPDLARAEQLAGHRRATAVMYTPNVAPWLQEAQIIRSNLRPLGVDVSIKQFPIDEFFTRIGRRGEPFDLAVAGWTNNNADPVELLGIFDGSSIRAVDNADYSYLDDPRFDRELHAVARLSAPERYRAVDRLELHLLRDLAPAAPFATDASRDFFSTRIGCQLYQPVFGIDLAALCLR